MQNYQTDKNQSQGDERQGKLGEWSGLMKPIGALRGSQTMKIFMICALVVLLQIPIFKINDAIHERQVRSNEAQEEVGAKWGRVQNIIGPILTVPFERKTSNNPVVTGVDGKPEAVVVEYAHFLAEELQIEATTDNSLRRRGIYQVPVYRAELTLAGRFARPDFTGMGVTPSKILWDSATLTVLVGDPRTITNQVSLRWNEETLEFQTGNRDLLGRGKGIEAVLKDKFEADFSTFSYQLSLQGSGGMFFAPMGKNTTASLVSNWPNPSFQGDWLPVEHSIDAESFRAQWQISSLGRKFSQRWISCSNQKEATAVDLFGVNFVKPIDAYRMAERSVKYQFLFLALTFITLWLFEVLANVRLHAIQYLLVGGGMCLFYLLELSLAEHMSFTAAYFCASGAIVALQGSYCLAILGAMRRSAVIGGLLLLLYGYLYTLLINQDYALLAGTVGLFLLLAAIMYLTRKIDWYSLRS